MKSILSWTKALVLLAVVVCVFGGTVFGQPWDGNGIEGDPYLIYTAADMQAIGADSNYWDAHFELMADVNLGGFTGTQFNMIGESWNNLFSGIFDGNGHAISNFTWASSDLKYIGVFRRVGDGGQIKNLGLVNVDVNSSANFRDFVGGLVGFNDSGLITNCYVSGSVKGYSDVGGLVGFNSYGEVIDCYSMGSVSGEWVGGLVGINWESPIINCYSTADVNGNSGVGGLVGVNLWTITGSYSTGAVSGSSDIGGLVGENDWYGEIINCYSRGSVSGSNRVGGLVGYSDAESIILNCYSMGSVEGTSAVGGFIGGCHASATVTDSFWDVNSSGEPNSAGGEGKTTANMQTESTFTDAGWDFNTPIWKMCDGPDYPKLGWEECPVSEPAELIVHLLEEVEGLELPSGISNGLEAKLEAALRALEDANEKNDVAAINSLEAFINAVEAQRGKKIPEADADALIAAALDIIDLLSAE